MGSGRHWRAVAVLFVVGVGLLLPSSEAGAISILSFDSSRSSRPFSGGDYDGARAFLTNPGNFGAGGVCPESVSILSAVSSVSAASLVGVDIFVLTEQLDSSPLSAAEITALRDFLLAGGDLMVVTDSGSGDKTSTNAMLAQLDGTSLATDQVGSNFADLAIVNSTPALTLGVFGPVGPINATPGSTITPGTALVPVGTNQGSLILGEMLPGALGGGSGGVLLMTDVLFMDFFIPSDPDNETYLGNWVAQSAGDAIPEPTTLLLVGAGLLGAAIVRRRRR